MSYKLLNYLPWRFRSLQNLKLVYANMFFSDVLKTKPIECSPDANTEMHSLVCKRDLNMYILAIKSFLKHYRGVSVVAHDDGSLTDSDFKVLREHIKHIKIIPRSEADKIIANELSPELCSIRNECFFMLKVFDFNFFNDARKTILLDSDILFLDSPDEVIAWDEDENPKSFYNKDPFEVTFRSEEKGITNYLNYFNSGFIGYPGKFSMETLSSAVNKIKCFFEDQTIYSHLLGSIGALPLDRGRFFVHDGSPLPQEACMVHFISSHRFYGSNYVRLARKVIKSL